MFEFAAPWALLLLALLPLVARRRLAGAARRLPAYSTAFRADALHRTWRQRSLWIILALELLALVLLVVAFARPRSGVTQRPITEEGVAIQLVIDRSGSMERDDFQLDGKWVPRFDAVKNVAAQFIQDSEMLASRSDVVGLVMFARAADRASLLTLDHDYVVARLREARLALDYREDGTAIGDALGLAVAGLEDYATNRTLTQTGRPLKKVVVLLTDGEQNAGEVGPVEAASLARAVDVVVHVIGIRPMSEATQKSDGTTELREMAEMTGGRFYEASDTDALLGIYREIAALEKVKLPAEQYTDYREWAIEPFRIGTIVFPSLVLSALLLLAAKVLLSRTVYRTIP